MRIWHVIETLDMGGAESLLVEMANAMSGKHDVTVCCLKHTGPLAKKLAPGRIRIIDWGKKEGNDYVLPLRIASRIRDEKVGVVHSHDWGTFCESALAARLGGAKAFVHTAHGDFPVSGAGRRGRKYRIRRVVERILSRWAGAIVAVSDELGAAITRETGIPREKIRIIRNGIRFRVPEPSCVASLRERLALPENAFVILAVGRLAPVKNLRTLIEGFRMVQRRHGDAMLLLVGDGPDRPFLSEMVERLELGRHVRMLGERDDVPVCLGMADIYVNSSLHEGISLALLEALSMKVAAIATDVGGNREIIVDGESGILVPPGDPKSLCTEICRLIGDGETRNRIALGGFERVTGHFSFERMIGDYEALYSECLGPG